MKLWTLLYKRFQSFSFPVLVYLPLSTLLVSYSCEAVPPPKTVAEVSTSSLLLATGSPLKVPMTVELCEAHQIQLSMSITSAVGEHYVQLQYPRLGPSPIVVKVDEDTFKVNHRFLFNAQDMQAICQKSAPPANRVAAIDAEASFTKIKGLLTEVAPHCDFTLQTYPSNSQTGALSCLLPEIGPVNALAKVAASEKQLIRYRSRHPYLLARRIAITRKLAETLSKFEEPAPKRLCQIQQSSALAELPLPLKAIDWPTVWCQNNKSLAELKTILGIQVDDSLREIAYLLQGFKDTKTGVLTLRLPKDQINRRDFWVKLEPLTIEGLPPQSNQACFWHPLYKNIQYKTHLSLYTPSPQANVAECVGAKVPKNADQALATYYTTSVSSETEFPLSNGRGKILALPRGTYRYSLHPTDNPFAKPEISGGNETLGQGQIEWKSRKPYPVIRSKDQLSRR